MEVKCPHCSSRFNLPDSSAKPGVKLRCSVCKTVFVFDGDGKPAAQKKSGRSSSGSGKGHGKLMLGLVIVLLLCLAGGGAFWFLRGKDDGHAQPVGAMDLAKKVEKLTLRHLRQYFVENEKVGKVFVIEGHVVNEFAEPKELISVEAALYDAAKKPLATKTQLAGTQLSLFQLQVLSEKEMEAFLTNKVEVLSNNTNVPHGGEVPFMVLFYAPPEGLVAEFGLRIVDVKDVGKR